VASARSQDLVVLGCYSDGLLGGIIVPFIGIKAIDVIVTALHLA